MGPRSKRGPGRADANGDATGRVARTSSGTGRVGRYTPPEQSGRYTRPIPKNVRRSARWFGPLLLFLLIFGILMILLNYLTVLPGSVSTWYLVAGLVIIFTGFIMATRYR